MKFDRSAQSVRCGGARVSQGREPALRERVAGCRVVQGPLTRVVQGRGSQGRLLLVPLGPKTRIMAHTKRDGMKVEVLNDVVRLIRHSTQTQTFAMQSACCPWRFLNVFFVPIAFHSCDVTPAPGLPRRLAWSKSKHQNHLPRTSKWFQSPSVSKKLPLKALFVIATG